jgi:hypothetical protein
MRNILSSIVFGALGGIVSFLFVDSVRQYELAAESTTPTIAVESTTPVTTRQLLMVIFSGALKDSAFAAELELKAPVIRAAFPSATEVDELVKKDFRSISTFSLMLETMQEALDPSGTAVYNLNEKLWARVVKTYSTRVVKTYSE